MNGRKAGGTPKDALVGVAHPRVLVRHRAVHLGIRVADLFAEPAVEGAEPGVAQQPRILVQELGLQLLAGCRARRQQRRKAGPHGRRDPLEGGAVLQERENVGRPARGVALVLGADCAHELELRLLRGAARAEHGLGEGTDHAHR